MEYQLLLANRPLRYELWIYSDTIIDSGAVQIGSKEIKLKININSNSTDEITQHIGIDEWRAGKAVVVGIKDRKIGDVEEVLDNVQEKIIKTGQINLFLSSSKHVMLEAEEYTGRLPNITVTQEIIDNINNMINNEIRIESINNGILKTWP